METVSETNMCSDVKTKMFRESFGKRYYMFKNHTK